MDAKLTLVIISEYIHISNHQDVCLKLLRVIYQLYLNKMGNFLFKLS